MKRKSSKAFWKASFIGVGLLLFIGGGISLLEPYLVKKNTVTNVLSAEISASPKPTTPTPAATSSGYLRFTKPIGWVFDKAECGVPLSRSPGVIRFAFPDAITPEFVFSLGPLIDGLTRGQENNQAYTGPGTYNNIGYSGKTSEGTKVSGIGIVMVNADERTGTFTANDGSLIADWDCGKKIPEAVAKRLEDPKKVNSSQPSADSGKTESR